MRVRAPREEDVAAILGLLNATTQAAYGTDDLTEDELRRWLTTPGLDWKRDIRLALVDGRLVGYADVDSSGEHPVRWWCDVRVAPDAPAETVARPLVAWAEQRAGSGILRTWVPSVNRPLKRALERLGFRLVRHSYRMAIALDGELEEARWPRGIAVRTFRSGDERGVYEAHEEAFADSWEHSREPYEEWAHWLLEREDFDGDLWFLAIDGEEIAGLALCRADATEPEAGWVGILAVRRPWRRQGLGRALLQHAFAEFRRRGYRRVQLGVDAESLTGANRLYERAGMRVVRQLDFYEKTVFEATL